MVNQSARAVVINDPNGLGHQLWRRVNGVPLVVRPASSGLMQDNCYRFSGNLANEVFSRYMGGTRRACHVGGTLPLHLNVMPKLQSNWSTSLPVPVADRPFKKSIQHNLMQLKLSRKSRAVNPDIDTTLADSNKLAFQWADRAYKADQSHSRVQLRQVASIPITGDQIDRVILTRILAPGHSSFLPDAMFRTTKERYHSKSLASKGSLRSLHLRRMGQSDAAERGYSKSESYSVGSGEPLFSSLHSHRQHLSGDPVVSTHYGPSEVEVDQSYPRVQLRQVASIPITGDQINRVMPTHVSASGHSPFLPDAMFRTTKERYNSKTFASKGPLGLHQKFTPLRSLHSLHLRRMDRSSIAEREHSKSNSFSAGSGERLFSSLHPHRQLVSEEPVTSTDYGPIEVDVRDQMSPGATTIESDVSPQKSVSLTSHRRPLTAGKGALPQHMSRAGSIDLSSTSSRYLALLNATGFAEVQNQSVSGPVQRSIGIPYIPANAQRLRNRSVATFNTSYGAAGVGNPRYATPLIHRAITPTKFPYRRSAEIMFNQSGPRPNLSCLPFATILTMGSENRDGSIMPSALRGTGLIRREIPAIGVGRSTIRELRGHEFRFEAPKSPIRRQSSEVEEGRLGHRSIEEPFKSAYFPVPMRGGHATTHASIGEIRPQYVVTPARMIARVARNNDRRMQSIPLRAIGRLPGIVSPFATKEIAAKVMECKERINPPSLIHRPRGETRTKFASMIFTQDSAYDRQVSPSSPQLSLQRKFKATSRSRNSIFNVTANPTGQSIRQADYIQPTWSQRLLALARYSSSHQLDNAKVGERILPSILRSRLTGREPATMLSGYQETSPLISVGFSGGHASYGMRRTVSDVPFVGRPEMILYRSRGVSTVGQSTIVPGSAIIDGYSTVANANLSSRHSWSGPPIVGELPLVSNRKNVTRMPAQLDQSVASTNQFASLTPLQAAEGNPERSADRANSTRTSTQIESNDLGKSTRTDLEDLTDKLWQKIQRKLIVERERNGLLSR